MSHFNRLRTLLCLAGMFSRAAATAPLLNASSLSSSYKIPPANATIAATLQNSSAQYVYGNCANDTALSTAYTTMSSHNTIIVSTIAPSATCCTKCEIGADMVRLVYWKPDPTESASDSQTTPYTLVSDNYTFTSPSVYVIYSTLMAIYDCDINSAPNVGPVYDEVTIGYPPDALSTGVCYHTNWRSINYTELYYPPPDYEVITQAACSMDYGDLRTVDSSGILAGSPIFSIPGGVSQLNPLWSTCTPAAPGGYDPPRALTKTGNLVPTPTSRPVTQAKPEPSATLELPAETGPASTANGANVGQTSQDPSSPDETDPQDPGAASGGDPGSTTGKQDGKASGSDPQDTSTSSIPSAENGENPGSTPQENGGNDVPGPAEGSKANGADPQDSDVSNSPGSASKGDPNSVSPDIDNSGESEIGASLNEASGGGLQLGTVTIAPGVQTTHSGHIFSVGSNFVLVDGTSFDLQSTNPVTPPGLAYTGVPPQQDGSGGGVVVGTTKFPPGAQTTYSGHTFSVGSHVFAIDGTSYSEAAGGGLILGSATLPPGAQMTQSGHVISVDSNSVVVDGTSYAWAGGASSPTSTPASDNLGGLIMSAFGTGSSSSVLAFTGDAARLRVLSRPGLLTTMMTTYIMYIYIL